MRKRSEDSEVRSKNDTFMTGHGKIYSDISNRMSDCIQELKNNGFKVWRYKIEDTLLDSKFTDHFKLLECNDGR